jgi:hypothetical protein
MTRAKRFSGLRITSVTSLWSAVSRPKDRTATVLPSQLRRLFQRPKAAPVSRDTYASATTRPRITQYHCMPRCEATDSYTGDGGGPPPPPPPPDPGPHPDRQQPVDEPVRGGAVAQPHQQQPARFERGDEPVEHQLRLRDAFNEERGVHHVESARRQRNRTQIAQVPAVQVGSGQRVCAQQGRVDVDARDVAFQITEIEPLAPPAAGLQDVDPLQRPLAGVLPDALRKRIAIVDRRSTQISHESRA